MKHTRLLAAALALALALGLCAPALAAEDAADELPVQWLPYESVNWYGDFDEDGVLLQYGADGKYGLLRTDGTPLTGAVFDEIWWEAVGGFIPVKNGGKWGKIDLHTGALAVDFLYGTPQETFSPVNAQLVGAEGGPYAVAALDGTLLSDYQYWDYAPFCYGLAAVFTASGWGYVDETGAEVIPCRYYSGGVGNFDADGFAWVNGSEGYNIVDRTGREVFERPVGRLLSERPWPAGCGLWGFVGENGLIGFVNPATGARIAPQYRMESDPKGLRQGGLFNSAGYALVWDASGSALAIDVTGAPADPALAIPDGAVSDPGGLHSVAENGKYGFRDETGALIVPCVFDMVMDFSGGVALVQKDGVFGLLRDPRKAWFSDVSADAWYAPYVDFVAQTGVMLGVGDGRFEPERELTRTECLTLALRLYDLMRGGDGVLPHAPEDWGRITLTLSDGTVYSGYGQELAGENPCGLWRQYSTAGMFGHGERRIALRCVVTEAEKDRIDALEDQTATAELNGKTYPGTVHCWRPADEWVMDFNPDATEEYEDVFAALYDAVRYGADPANWFRDTVYALWATVPEAERSGFAAVSDWRLGAAAALRLDFAQAVAAAAGELEGINAVDGLPDTGDAAVLALYRAGILNGVDALGSFAPERTLTRAEAAAMVARVLDPALRIRSAP